MFTMFELRLRAGLARAARNLVGVLFLLVGLAFLTFALWIALAESQGVLVAALVLGGAYAALGIGLMLFRRPPPPPPPAMSAQMLGPLIEAFLAGRAAGRDMRRDD